MPWLTLSGSNYPCLERIFMVPKVFEPLRVDCCILNIVRASYLNSYRCDIPYLVNKLVPQFKWKVSTVFKIQERPAHIVRLFIDSRWQTGQRDKTMLDVKWLQLDCNNTCSDKKLIYKRYSLMCQQCTHNVLAFPQLLHISWIIIFILLVLVYRNDIFPLS